MARTIVVLLVVLFQLGFVSAPAWAQDVRGHIQGVIRDSSNAPIPGADVNLANLKLGVATEKKTTEAGLYRFDFVEPGTYTITISTPGFSKFVQESFVVEAQGDVTIDASLTPGAVQETVEVKGLAIAVQFNTANVALTVDTKLAEELPLLNRNPFKLSLLVPNAVETRRGEMNPYNSWAANSIDLGGGTDKKNDLLIDGSPVGISYKSSWSPNSDAVQEANVQQNGIDSEFGHSAGGTISLNTKSGTNEIHGTLTYVGRNPALNAVTDRTTNTFTAARNNIWSVSAGNSIVKNKLFNFFSIERQQPRSPGVTQWTMPTAAERGGDFSKSLNIDGNLRVIYDPYTTSFNAATNTATRQPFAGNVVPPARFDPFGARIMKNLAQYEPNSTPNNVTGLNNFRSVTKQAINYWDWSDRVDWYVGSKWRVFGRIGVYDTNILTDAPGLVGNELYLQGGSKRSGKQIVANAIYSVSSNSVLELRFGMHNFTDEYFSPNNLGSNDALAKYWPDDPWYKAYAYNPETFGTYLPGIRFGTANLATLGNGGTIWSQHPDGKNLGVKLSNQRGAHTLKFGFESRMSGGYNTTTSGNIFLFEEALTANTFLNPNTRVSGNQFATALLGSISNTSSLAYSPTGKPRTKYYAGFIQDDFKLNSRLSLNLGLRWDLETPWSDPGNQFSKGPDLSAANPAIQNSPPPIPSSVTSMLKEPYSYKGQWVFTSKDSPGMWKTQWNIFMPRIGVAYRLTDRAALRFGYARYVTPAELNFQPPPFAGFENEAFIEPPQPGFGAQQTPLPLNLGVPQATIAHPFPASSNPLVPPAGKSNGGNFGLGLANVLYGNPDFTRPVNDRYNLAVSVQLPARIVLEATQFMNRGRNWNYAYNLNQVDVRPIYQYQGATAANVANPFLNYLTPAQFPGPLRNQATIPIQNLLRKYPQYGGLWQSFTPGQKEQYYSTQLMIRRAFASGYNLSLGYSYIREKSEQFLNPLDAYVGQMHWQESTSPHNRFTLAGTYQLPFGQGRQFLAHTSRVVDYALGGWQLIGAMYGNTGNFLQFGPANVSCADPTVAEPTPTRQFNTSCFSILGPFSPRVNPWLYRGLTGPAYWSVDANLTKKFVVRERYSMDLRISAYNLTNRLNRADPSVNITATDFGQSLRQTITTGRQLEFGARILF